MHIKYISYTLFNIKTQAACTETEHNLSNTSLSLCRNWAQSSKRWVRNMQTLSHKLKSPFLAASADWCQLHETLRLLCTQPSRLLTKTETCIEAIPLASHAKLKKVSQT